MRAAIVVFPGSNCDRDVYHVLSDVYNINTTYVWHEDRIPTDTDIVILPGGFSYGDRLRAGAIAAHSPVMADIKTMADDGTTSVLGICNGFQILVESEILPGALLTNDSAQFMCHWTSLSVQNTNTPFTNMLSTHQKIPIPVANGEGRYYADQDTMHNLKKNNQIVFKYNTDINGSTEQIAGICNKNGNVVGMMPHPERAAEPQINPQGDTATSLIFSSLIYHHTRRRK